MLRNWTAHGTPETRPLPTYKYKADIRRWGCQDQSGNDAIALCALPSWFYAEVPYFKAVARVNHKGWPVTEPVTLPTSPPSLLSSTVRSLLSHPSRISRQPAQGSGRSR